MLSLSSGEEGCEVRQPLLAAGHQIPRRERVGKLLQAMGSCAFREGVGALLEADAFLAHAVGQPMVLVEADAGGKWKVGADAYEHSSPVPVIDVKIVLNDPTMRELEVPSVRDLVADGSHDARRFSRFEDDHDGVGLGPFEIWVDELVTTMLVEGVHDRLPAAVPTAGIVAVILGSQSWLPLVIPLSSTALSSRSGARDIKGGALG